MKVGNVIGGLTVTDVKRVNRLNLIQFLKEVDNYLQQDYRIDVNSARQVGLVLQADVYKVEQPFGHSVGSASVQSVGEQVNFESDKVESTESVAEVVEPVEVEETKAVEDVKVEPLTEQPKPEVVDEAPKKTTTRSKKTAQ